MFVSRPKEPHYFCDDWDYYYAPGERSEEHYLRLFDDATDDHLAVGEASVWYLYSATAARNIAAFDPAMRVIVMVRNPVELVPSLHSQLRYMLDEDEPDPERAWDLQEARAAGERPAADRPGAGVPPVRRGGEPRRPAPAGVRVLPARAGEGARDGRPEGATPAPSTARRSPSWASPTTGARSSRA